jgi:hypothetical protein
MVGCWPLKTSPLAKLFDGEIPVVPVQISGIDSLALIEKLGW